LSKKRDALALLNILKIIGYVKSVHSITNVVLFLMVKEKLKKDSRRRYDYEKKSLQTMWKGSIDSLCGQE
jgi:hypothetical protein